MDYKVIIGSLGIGGDIYQSGDIVYLDPESHQVEALLAAGDIVEAADPLQELLASNTRPKLDDMAEALGIDVSEFTNKTQVAEAILKAGE